MPLPNVGRESQTFLHHIVTNYDQLADWTVFTQANAPSFGYRGHRSGGGHLAAGVRFDDYLQGNSSSFVVHTSALRVAEDGVLYAALRRSYVLEDPPDARASSLRRRCPPRDEWSDWWPMGWFQRMLEDRVADQRGMSAIEFFNTFVSPGAKATALRLVYPQGARMAVSRRALRARSRSYYTALLDTVNKHPDPWAGYYLEWMWPIVIGRPYGECPVPSGEVVSYDEVVARLQRRALLPSLHPSEEPVEGPSALASRTSFRWSICG